MILVKEASVRMQNDYLSRCRTLSRNKPKWSARNYLKTKQDTLFVESAKLLFRALIMEAKETKPYDPAKAANLCRIARKRATECKYLLKEYAL